MKIKLLLLLSVLFFTMISCGPSINLAYKKSIDSKLSAVNPSGRTVSVPTSPKIIPLAVGQWVTWKEIDQDGHPSIVTFKIVGQDGDAFWFERSSETYFAKTAVRYLVTIKVNGADSGVTLHRYMIKDEEGNISEIPQQNLSIMRSMGTINTNAFDSGSYKWGAAKSEDITVMAGTFKGAYNFSAEIKFGPWSYDTVSWGHPAVPINGVVKSESKDKKYRIELIDFGETGATSDFVK